MSRKLIQPYQPLRKLSRPVFNIAVFIVAHALCCTPTALAEQLLNGPRLYPQNLKVLINEFTAAPHPMGSQENINLAKKWKDYLSTWQWHTRSQVFEAYTPSSDGAAEKLTLRRGENIIASKTGKQQCGVMFGAHYDTKLFKEFRFVGANDGGSGTALLLELARTIQNNLFFISQDSWLNCDIHIVFFDGEEAILPDWNAARQLGLGFDDHLYGSHFFVQSLSKDFKTHLKINQKPLVLVVILDMVGHKNQQLSITQGSNPELSKTLTNFKGSLDIKMGQIAIEDDHTPFLKYAVPTIHLIDFTNLQQWHTPNDTPDILSYAKLAELGEILLKFLSSQKLKK